MLLAAVAGGFLKNRAPVDDVRYMALDDDPTPGLHFAGVNTRLLVRYLREQEIAGAVQQVLRAAGDPRSEDELADNATWSSYDQFRRLLARPSNAPRAAS